MTLSPPDVALNPIGDRSTCPTRSIFSIQDDRLNILFVGFARSVPSTNTPAAAPATLNPGKANTALRAESPLGLKTSRVRGGAFQRQNVGSATFTQVGSSGD